MVVPQRLLVQLNTSCYPLPGPLSPPWLFISPSWTVKIRICPVQESVSERKKRLLVREHKLGVEFVVDDTTQSNTIYKVIVWRREGTRRSVPSDRDHCINILSYKAFLYSIETPCIPSRIVRQERKHRILSDNIHYNSDNVLTSYCTIYLIIKG